MKKKENKKNFKFGIKQKTLSFIAFPCLMICLFTSIYAVISYQNVIEKEVEEKLLTAAHGATIISESLGMKAANMMDQIDSYAEETNVEITIFEGDVRAVSSIDGAVGTTMDPAIKEELLTTGENLFTTNANVNGEAYFGYYIPFIYNDDLAGSVFAGVSQADAQATIFSNVRNLIICIIAITIVFLFIAAIMISRLLKKLFGSVDLVKQLHDNDLAVQYDDKFKKNADEYEEIYNSTYEFASNLNGIVSNIKTASEDLHSISVELNGNANIANATTEEIARAVENVSTGAQDQAEDTQHVVESVANMGEDIEHITVNTNSLTNTANKMNDAKEKVVETLEVLSNTNNATMLDVQDVNQQISLTNECIESIFKDLSLIQAIADQTNLLSLNASIEAARAGELGKGFAVVAEEIKTLADQSSESSREINENLNSLVRNYQLIIEKMDQTTNNINAQNEKLAETKANFVTLETGINDTNRQIELINNMVEKLNKERDSISEIILNLSAISEENAASTEEIMASIEELNSIVTLVDEKANGLTQLSNELATKVGIFKI